MKKVHFLILVLLLTLSINDLKAQKIHFGIQAGIGGAKYITTNNYLEEVNESYYELPKNYLIPSFGGSFYFSYKLTDEFNIALVPGFVRSGNRVKSYISETNITNIYTQLDNFQLPILIEYALVDKFYLTFGPELNFLYGAHLSSANNRLDVFEKYKNHRFNIGLQLGTYYSVTKNIDLGINVSQMISNTEKLNLINEEGMLIEEINYKSASSHFFVRFKM